MGNWASNINVWYGENNPIVVKSEFIMSLIEQIDKKGVGPQHKSIKGNKLRQKDSKQNKDTEGRKLSL